MYFLIATTSFSESDTTAGVNTAKKSCLSDKSDKQYYTTNSADMQDIITKVSVIPKTAPICNLIQIGAV